MSKHSIELDRTTYFRILKECVDKSGKALAGQEIVVIFEKHIKKENEKFDVAAIRQELYHNSVAVKVKDDNSKTGERMEHFYSLRYESYYRYFEMIEFKESRIASKSK